MSYILNRAIVRTAQRISRLTSCTTARGLASKEPLPKENPEEPNKPLNYLDSPAAQWRAQWSVQGKDTSPWFERYVVLACISVFMLYFCVLREENDVDEKLKGSLFENVPGMEEQSLLVLFKYNIEHGGDIKEVEKRMRELGMDVEGLRKKYLV